MATEAPLTDQHHMKVQHEENAAEKTQVNTDNEGMTKIDDSPKTEALLTATEQKDEAKIESTAEGFEMEAEALKCTIDDSENLEAHKKEPVVEVRDEELKQLQAASDVSDKSSGVAQEVSNEVIEPVITERANHDSKEETPQVSEVLEKQSEEEKETPKDLETPVVQDEFHDVKEVIPEEGKVEHELEEPTIIEHTSSSSGSKLEEEIYTVQKKIAPECLEAGTVGPIPGNHKEENEGIAPRDLGSDKFTYEDAIIVTETYKEEEPQVNESAKEDVEVMETLETSKDADAATDEVTKSASEGEKTSGNITVTEKEKDDNLLGGNQALVETLRDVEVDRGAISKDVEVQEEKTSTDAKEPETTEEIGDPRTTCKQASKEEVPPKPSGRHSNKLLHKLKQSIAKVKKAIGKKSSNSKTITTETKECIQVT